MYFPIQIEEALLRAALTYFWLDSCNGKGEFLTFNI